jgi:outer membrane protein
MMHKRVFATFAIAAAMLAAAPAFADLKIAIVRGDDVVANSPQYKAAQDKMKGEFEKRKEEFDTQAKLFQDDGAKFQRDADTMTPDARAKAAKDLDTRRADLAYTQQKLQEDFQTRRNELSQNVMSKVRDVIYQIAKEKGYDLVVADPVYFAPSIDITDEVLKRLAAMPAAPAAK